MAEVSQAGTGELIQKRRARPVPLSKKPKELALAANGNQGEAEILHRAAEVIGSKGDAMRWMGTPVRALNYATPVSLLHTRKGRDAVLTVLGRIEHGVL